METIISTNSLSFSYQRQQVVKGLNLQIQSGSIYGFLGPNGAGKSTTIRLILGLLKPATGEVKIFNKDFKKNRLEILKQIGNLIEGPSFYEHLSATDNLKIHCKLKNMSFKRIDFVLKIVNLTDSADKKVKSFSMGMKQRLNIASALIHDPEILILDEPTNGLDPQGIKDIRKLIINLNVVYGKTVFISSHLLSEIELMCSQIGIIKEGELIYQGSIDSLNSVKNSTIVYVEGIDLNQIAIISQLQGVCSCKQHTNELILEVQLDPDFSLKDFTNSICKQGVHFEQLYKKKNSLEELFLNLTQPSK